MKRISNKKLIDLLASRDKISSYHRGELKKSIQVSIDAKRAFFNGDTFKPGNLYEVEMLISRLCDPTYRLTEEDVEVLKVLNVFAVADSEESFSSEDKSFVALSDFHGYEYPLEKITEYYIDEYDCVYILGDACDRGPNGYGTGSIEILLKIKELSKKYPGKVIYVPGNHDEFIVGMAHGSESDRRNLVYNGGIDTVRELELLRRKDPEKYFGLINWLENLPIQRKHKYNGKIYALAHAFFDEKLYAYNPHYSLRNMFEEYSECASRAENVLWFRKGDPYDVQACPTSDTVMVIGHTRTNTPGDRSYDLEDQYGKTVSVHCVDGGIAYNGYAMLKYDGGTSTTATFRNCHNDTSPKKSSDEDYELDEKKAVLHNYFIDSMYAEKGRFFDITSFKRPKELTSYEVFDVVDCINGVKGFTYSSQNPREQYAMYKKIFVFDYILGNIILNNGYYEGGLSEAAYLVNGYLFGNSDEPTMKSNLTCFTRYRDIRYFAELLGGDNMKEVLAAYNCSSVGEYLDLKFNVQEKDKPKIFGKLKPID